MRLDAVMGRETAIEVEREASPGVDHDGANVPENVVVRLPPLADRSRDVMSCRRGAWSPRRCRTRKASRKRPIDFSTRSGEAWQARDGPGVTETRLSLESLDLGALAVHARGTCDRAPSRRCSVREL